MDVKGQILCMRVKGQTPSGKISLGDLVLSSSFWNEYTLYIQQKQPNFLHVQNVYSGTYAQTALQFRRL